ncbi:MAG: hypothetical protein ACOX7R_12495 [Acetivibrionales bacterium]|jgi:hypothetical protein
MDYQKLKREIKTIGAWYLATFISDILENYNDLQDLVYKQNFIFKLQAYAAGGDISLESTTAKVNGMIRIVKSKKVKEALEIIIEETNPNKVPEETLECAAAMLKYIDDGKIRLPY